MLYAFVNGYAFLCLADKSYFCDRPEPYREQEKSLWILYQLLKIGNEVIISGEYRSNPQKITNTKEYINWVEETYPNLNFSIQFDEKIFTSSPNSADYYNYIK